MITFLLSLMSRRWRVACLVLLAILLVPSFALAVSMTEVIEMFKYSYGADKMMYLASVETVIYNLLKRRKKRVGGRGQWIIPYRTQNGGVMRGMPEGDALTNRRAQPDTKEAMFSLIEFQAVWDITWKMLRQASRSQDAFETAMNFMDDSVRTRVFRVINSQVCSFTGRGELAMLTATDDQVQMTVNSLPFMDQGMLVDLMDASDDTTVLAAARSVTDIDVSGRQVTIDGAAPAGTAAGDYFVPADTVQGGVNYSLYGLGIWLDDGNPPAVVGNLGGIDRTLAGNGFYKGNVLSNGGTLRAFTEDLMIDGENLMRERGGIVPSRYAANGPIIKRYHGDLIQDRFFSFNKIQGVGGDEIGKAGFGRQGMDLNNSPDGTGETPYTISGKPLHQEPYLRANRLIGWNDDNFFIGHDGIEVPTPLSEIFDDMIPYFTHTGSAKFDVWHYWEAQLLSDNPQAGIVYKDLAES
jgi:hypothetical protein